MEALRLSVLLASVVGLAIGALSLMVSRRERRRGSPAWAWGLPLAAGMALIAWSLVRLAWVAA